MFGFAFERIMEQLLAERGYKVLSADSLGYDPSELLAIAKEANPKAYSSVGKYFKGAEQNMSCKDILDHFYKIDCLLELPRKRGEAQTVVGIQWYNYNESDQECESKIKKKLGQLEQSWPACQELYLASTFVVAGFVPSSWEGMGLRTETQNKALKLMICNLVHEMAQKGELPRVLNLNFDF